MYCEHGDEHAVQYVHNKGPRAFHSLYHELQAKDESHKDFKLSASLLASPLQQQQPNCEQVNTKKNNNQTNKHPELENSKLHPATTYLKCNSLKVKCVSMIPVVLTRVRKTSCSVGI